MQRLPLIPALLAGATVLAWAAPAAAQYDAYDSSYGYSSYYDYGDWRDGAYNDDFDNRYAPRAYNSSPYRSYRRPYNYGYGGYNSAYGHDRDPGYDRYGYNQPGYYTLNWWNRGW